jgi:hypothetical protein
MVESRTLQGIPPKGGRPQVRRDVRAMAAIKDADYALTMIDNALGELRDEDEVLREQFYTFASKLADKLSIRVSKTVLDDLREMKYPYPGAGDITTWINK